MGGDSKALLMKRTRGGRCGIASVDKLLFVFIDVTGAVSDSTVVALFDNSEDEDDEEEEDEDDNDDIIIVSSL